MKFSDVVDQARALLQRTGKLTYRVLKREFVLDDEALEDLKEQLIDAEALAIDQDGRMLVWTGGTETGGVAQRRNTILKSPLQHPTPHPQSPSSYTPKHLAERILAERAAMEARGVPDGERKTITALFADIKGSTSLIENLDPEEARRIIDPALKLMMDAVHRYEGYVAQSMGDGIFALFGAPIAHEDHAQRALYAALLMQEESRKQAEQLRLEKGVNLQVRVGVNTGEVVVRSIRKDDLHTDYIPVGHSTHVAARMENLATPGAILITEHTHKLVEGYFQSKPLGAAQIKGVTAPLNIYEVTGIGPLRTKLQVAAQRGLARFVGRQRELDALRNALEQAKAGRGQIASVMGEPGVGKSRLFHEFKLLLQSGCLLLETFSVSHGKAYPYLPLIDLLKNYFQLAAQDDERKRREKITGKVLTLDRSLEDTLPYLFFLLGVAEPTSSLQHMDPQIRRQRTLEAIKRLLVRESLNQPLLVIFEDLHWLDAETQAFLSLLSESIASVRIVLLVNYRPEYHHQWGNKTYYTQLRLDPLRPQEAEEMLDALLERKVGPQPMTTLQDLKRFILRKTEGNPFFMEEIVQELTERDIIGVSSRSLLPTDLHIPPTVQAVLASRIDRLPSEAKELLQTLAVIGKAFSLGLLKQVVGHSEETLHHRLSRLRDAEFIYEQPAFPEPDYVFKHALTQEVAYTSLLMERRKVLHEQAAQAIEMLFHDRLEDHYSELASHYSRSGNAQKAVDYLQLAGQQAVQRSAMEAVGLLTTALDLLPRLPVTPQRSQQELTLRVVLGPVLMATKGFASWEMKEFYADARKLSEQIADSSQLCPVLRGLFWTSITSGELRALHEISQQFLQAAQRNHERLLLPEAYSMSGLSLFWSGEFRAARDQVEQGSAAYDLPHHQSRLFLYLTDPGVLCLSYGAFALWQLGYPDQALQRASETLQLAQSLAHPHSLAHALLFLAFTHQLRREGERAQERIEESLTLSAEQGFSHWLALGAILRGWTFIEEQGEDGIALMRQGWEAFRSTGIKLWRPWSCALLIEAYQRADRQEEGLQLLTEAFAAVEETGERSYEAELYRLKGKLLLQNVRIPDPRSPLPGVQGEAEACFLKATAIAQRQSAKSLELRAAVSLAQLWRQQGKHHEARNTLSTIYHWFTEGFDTKDLQEAKALLDDLVEAH